MAGFRNTASAVRAISAAANPAFLGRIPGPPTPLLGLLLAGFVAHGIYKVLQARSLGHQAPWASTCTGAYDCFGTGGNICGATGIINCANLGQAIGSFGPVTGWKRTAVACLNPPNCQYTLTERWLANGSTRPWPASIASGYYEVGILGSFVDPRVIAMAAVGGWAAAAPGRTHVDHVIAVPVAGVPARDRVQQAIASLSSTMTTRGNAVPESLAFPAKPFIGREIVVAPPSAGVRPIDRAPAVPRTAAPPMMFATNEIKTKAYPIVSQFMSRFVGTPSEVNDMLQALHDALPKKCQVKSSKAAKQQQAVRRAGGWKIGMKKARTESFSLARAIANCADQMNIADAGKNLAREALVDRAYGGQGKALGQLNRQANAPLGVQQMVGKAPQSGLIAKSPPRQPETPFKTTFGDVKTRARALMNK